MTTGPTKNDTVSAASDPDICNRCATSVDGDKSIDASFQRRVEKRTNAAEVAEPFFRNSGGKGD